VLIKFGFGQLYVGRPDPINGRYDASMLLKLFHMPYAPERIPPWRIMAGVKWNWLPDRIYRKIGEVVPRINPVVEDHRRLVGMISGKPPVSAHAEHLLPSEYRNAADSARWTGRSRKFVGFGVWRWSHFYRATWRSLMLVYLTSLKERKQSSFWFSVNPGRSGLMKAAEVPAEWKEPDGEFKEFKIEYKYGRAEVDEQLGEWLVKHGMAHKSSLIRTTGKSILGGLAQTIRGY
jgi:hypothetical protein